MPDNTRRIWVCAEYSRGKLSPSTFELLTKARQLAGSMGHGARVGAVLAGYGAEGMAHELGRHGAEEVWLIDGPQFELYDPMTFAPAIERAVREGQPEIFLFAATARGSQLGPAVAARLRTGLAAHCVELAIGEDGNLISSVPSFGGKILAQILTPECRPQMASVKPGIFRADDAPCGGEPELIRVGVSDIARHEGLRPLGETTNEPEGMPVESAPIVLCAGYGVGGEECVRTLERIAARLGGAVACTRPVLDEGWIKSDSLMIGTSGRTIRPKIYIGFGISGAAHHICGIKDAGVIISVNKDENAPIFSVSDMGWCGDSRRVIAALAEALGIPA